MGNEEQFGAWERGTECGTQKCFVERTPRTTRMEMLHVRERSLGWEGKLMGEEMEGIRLEVVIGLVLGDHDEHLASAILHLNLHLWSACAVKWCARCV